MSKSSIQAGVLGVAVLFLSCVVVTPGSAQAPQNFQRPATAVQPALPNSVALPAAKVKPPEVVLVIPEAQIFKGIDLNESQRKALSANLRGADFKAKAVGTLTSGELQMMQVPISQPKFLMQLLPNPGEFGTAAIDPCTMSEISPAQVTALSKLIAAHLRSTGGDAAGFEANVPAVCVRQQVAYMIKSAAAVMK
jgi:hypothetical protein